MPKKLRMLTFDGQSKSISEWSRDTGLSGALIVYRLGAGWSVKDALTTKPHSQRSRKPIVVQSFADTLPALSAGSNRRELDRMRREMRRAFRTMIRQTEREAAAIGRTFSIAIAEMMNEQHRGVVENIRQSAPDQWSSVAQESINLGKFR